MSRDSAILVENLCVRFGEVEILKSVSFELAVGQQLAVIGPNGAGKSTLVRCLDGLVKPVAGRIELMLCDLATLTRRRLARMVSYVPQVDELNLDYTVRSFVEMGRYPHVQGWASLGVEDRAAVQKALELTETEHLGERTMTALSGGERQRVTIAAALAQGGRLLLLDEPTTFLDYRHQVQFAELIEKLGREHSMTVVSVTHDLNASVAASDVVLALKRGEVAFYGPPQELYRPDVLREIFETDFELVPVPWRHTPLVLAVGEAR